MLNVDINQGHRMLKKTIWGIFLFQKYGKIASVSLDTISLSRNLLSMKSVCTLLLYTKMTFFWQLTQYYALKCDNVIHFISPNQYFWLKCWPQKKTKICPSQFWNEILFSSWNMNTLNVFFRLIKSFIRFHLAFAFGLQISRFNG